MITRLYNYLTNIKGLMPEQARTIICQSAHETAFWTSNVFEHSNNLFGIKLHKRKVAGKIEGGYNGYTRYIDIQASCDDLIDLVRRRYDLEAANNIYLYAFSLKKGGYFEAPLNEYTAGMVNAYKQLFPESYAKYN